MKIEPTMDLYALAERMGTDATLEHAEILRDMIGVDLEGIDTADIDPALWCHLLDETEAQYQQR